MKKKIDLLNGSITKNIWKLAWPTIVAMIFHTGFNLVDTLFVGMISPQAIAAVSMSFPLIFLIIALGAGIGIGSNSVIARYIGANKKKEADNAAEHALLITIIVTILITILGVTFAEPLFKLMGAGEDILGMTTDYTKIIFGGSIFMFIAFIGNNILRAEGDSKTPMKVMMTATFLNIILDPIFIFGFGPVPRMEVMGAAIATVIARAAACFFVLYYLFKGKAFIKFNFKDFKYKFKYIREIFRIGFPASLSQMTMSLGMIFLLKIISLFGTYPIAAFGIATRLDSIAIMPAIGLSAAVITIVGHNMGAKNFKRAEKTTWKASLMIFLFMEIVGVIFFFFPEFFIRIFTKDINVIGYGASYFRITALAYGFIGISMVISAAFQGAGKGVQTLIINSLRLFIVSVPLAFFLAVVLKFGVIGIWIGIVSSTIVASVVSIIWFRLGTWKKGKCVRIKADIVN